MPPGIQRCTYKDLFLNLPYSEKLGVEETRTLISELDNWDKLPNDYPGKTGVFLLLKYAAFESSGSTGKTNRSVQTPEVPDVSGNTGHGSGAYGRGGAE